MFKGLGLLTEKKVSTTPSPRQLFLRQVVLQKGIPFELKIPSKKPLSVSKLTEEQFNVEIEKGLADVIAGKVVSVESVADRMEREYGI